MPKTSVKRRLAGLVFPVFCLGCGTESDWLCGACSRTLVISRPERCALCRRAGLDGICDRCRSTAKIDGIVALFDYHQQPIEQLVKRVKYLSLADGITYFAEQFRRKLLLRLPREEFVATFVPMSADRLASRGFNQAELLARAVAGDFLPVSDLLVKVTPTAPQASLDRSDRLKNLRGAFRLKQKPAPEAVVIFDDVVTTGATLSAAAKLLKKAGSRTVWAVTIAHD